MYTTYLLLGSNLGDRQMHLLEASRCIEDRLGFVLKRSSLYETASWGNHDLPDFINQVLYVQTSLNPRDLLKEILAIELDMGRKRFEKWGSRTIDIDILLYGDQIINETDLVIPHPLLHRRRFGLLPLLEIAPSAIHPVYCKTIRELIDELSDDLLVKKLS